MNTNPQIRPQPDHRLSAAQRERFEREGWIVVDGLLGADDLQPVIDEIQDEIDPRAAALIAAGELSRSHREAGFDRQLARISHETPKLARAIWNSSLAGPAFFGLIRSPRLLDVADDLRTRADRQQRLPPAPEDPERPVPRGAVAPGLRVPRAVLRRRRHPDLLDPAGGRTRW